MKSCLTCLYHGCPISKTNPIKRPCDKCIISGKFSEWVLTDKEVEYDSNVS